MLPACELAHLNDIAEVFSSSIASPMRRDQLARAVESSDYIPKLMSLFSTCEDLEDTKSLYKLYEIVKSLFLLNRSSLFDVMLQEEHIMKVVGCLEHDPALVKPNKHRDYLLHEVSFKEVLPIKNADLLKKIHQTFRLQYIQDVVLPTPSVFEENLLSTLSSIIFFNKVRTCLLPYLVVVVIKFLSGVVPLVEMAGFTPFLLQLLALHPSTYLVSGHPLSSNQSSLSPLPPASFRSSSVVLAFSCHSLRDSEQPSKHYRHPSSAHVHTI